MWESYISSVCRICLHDDIVDLCSKLEVSEEELMNSSLCTYCLKELEDVLKFRIKCTQTHEILNQKKNELVLGAEENALQLVEFIENDTDYVLDYSETEPAQYLIEEEVEDDSKKKIQEDDKPLDSDGFSIVKSEEVPDANIVNDRERFKDWHYCPYSGCDRYFEKDGAYKRHFLKVHLNQDFLLSCKSCTFNCQSFAEMRMHTILHSSTASWICDNCGMSFRFKASIRSHITRKVCVKNSIKPYVPDQAFDDFINEKFQSIPPCGTVFADDKKKMIMVCLVCQEKHRSLGTYKNHYFQKHLQIDEGEVSSYDNPKPEYFQNTLQYKRVLKWDKNENVISAQCMICSKIICEPRNYRKHYMNCHVESNQATNSLKNPNPIEDKVGGTKQMSTVQCNLCPSIFPTIKAFLQHMANEHDVKKFYKCDGCCRSFSSVNKLRGHKKTFHSDQKNFQCTECGQFFKCEKSLKYHTINIHKPEDKLNCPDPECSEKFVFQTQLNHHYKRDHLKVKSYACGLCERTYIRPKDCRDHIAGNHMNFVLKCPYCPVQSTQKPRYKYHLYKFHRNEPTYNEKVKEYQKIPIPNVEMYIKKIDTPIVDKKN